MEGHRLKLDLVHIAVIATLIHHFLVATKSPVYKIQYIFVTQVETLSHYNVLHEVIIVKTTNYYYIYIYIYIYFQCFHTCIQTQETEYYHMVHIVPYNKFIILLNALIEVYSYVCILI